MKACIENFMGCKRADIEASKIALLIGLNGQGKSSSLMPLASALSGSVMPLGLKKVHAGMVVRTGEASAKVHVEDDGGAVEIFWPKCEVKSVGENPPHSSEIAAGIINFVNLEDKTKIEILRALLKCEPTFDDLKEILTVAGINEDIIKSVWQTLDRDGWDATLERAQDKGKTLKAFWNKTTGETWGLKKGASWMPSKGWDDDLLSCSQDTLDGQLSAAKATLEFRIANQAVNENEAERLGEQCLNIDELATDISQLENELRAVEVTVEKAEAEFVAIPQIPDDGIPCPHCGKKVLLQFGKLVSAEVSISEVEKSIIEKRRLEANNAKSSALIKQRNLKNKLDALKAKRDVAVDAKTKFENNQKGTVSENDVEIARNEVAKSENRRQAFLVWNEAKRHHENIVQNAVIIDALVPEGIRRTALERGLSVFNQNLAEISALAGWGSVCIAADMTVTYAGRPYVVCSQSEKKRIEITIQIAVADLDKSSAVVIDAADILDPNGRAGLLRVLNSRDYSSFIGMMATAKNKVPALDAIGCGRVYWISGGNCEEVHNV